MKPLIVLLTTFTIALLTVKIVTGHYEFALPARIALSVMLAFTSIAHFAFTKGMILMVPDFIPYKSILVYATGIIEIMAAAGLHVPGYTTLTGWLLIVFFLLLLPANINAAFKHIDYQKGTTGGSGKVYLWFRVPLQIFFIGWTYFASLPY